MHTARRTVIALLAVFVAGVMSIASTLTLAAALAATALIVPGTGTPNANSVQGYLQNARDYYIAPFNPACTKDNGCVLQGIDYPAEFWPIPLPGWGGLDGDKWDVSTGIGLANLNSALVQTLAQNPPASPIVLMGYSQGGNIVSRQKRNLAGLPEDQTYLTFVMIGNANRPNGGLFERLAFFGHVPILDATFGLPATTDTCDHICATDIAFRYDGVADFPLYPLNGLAVLNAIAGFWYVHGTYVAPNADSDVGELPDDYTPEQLAAEVADENNWQEYGDTRYVTIPTKTLPIVRPFLELADATGTRFLVDPVVELVSPLLRVLIETGYDRSLNYGVPAPFRLIPRINPVVFVRDVIEAIGEGVDAVLGRRPATQPIAPTAVPEDSAETTTEVTAQVTSLSEQRDIQRDKDVHDTARRAEGAVTDQSDADEEPTGAGEPTIGSELDPTTEPTDELNSNASRSDELGADEADVDEPEADEPDDQPTEPDGRQADSDPPREDSADEAA